ncbi:ABC transporter permease [Chitinophaga sp. Hz27]|uniref:ABC transporter permease n=1 Tax=Chitinophaga sp. Hz27 TaxID=3347169 RepID=UPI0035E3B11B
MVRNYLKIAYRNLLRNKVFSAVNILGLAIGMASCLLLLLWVQDERHMGKHSSHLNRLYRVMEHKTADGRIVTDENMPGILPDELKREIPEIEYAAGILQNGVHILSAGENVARFPGCYVGADWFKIYDIPLLAGNSSVALAGPADIAISRKLATLYFHDPAAALGQVIRLDDNKDLKVTAVFEDLPANSLDKYEFLRNWDVLLKKEPWLNKWENSGPGTRILLKPHTDPEKVNAKLKDFLVGRNKDLSASYNITLFLQPEADVYLYSNFADGKRIGGRIEYVRLFVIVAAFLLLIAAINFMNLSTARAVKRAKEVGVRKVVGAQRHALVWQFMNEALLMTVISAIIALALVWLVLPVFNDLTGKQLLFPATNPAFWALFTCIVLLTAVLSGSYPAFFLSAVKPLLVLKGLMKAGPQALGFRRMLVVFQFVLSVLMIAGTIVVYQQLKYIQTKNLGYDRTNLIVIQGEGAVRDKFQAFKQELLQSGSITAVTHMQNSPLENGNTTDAVRWTGQNTNVAIQFSNTAVGYDFVKTMNLQVLEGRDFSPGFGADTANYIINEAAAKRLGYANPVGQPLAFGQRTGTIIGLVKDFHFNSLHEPIRPLIIRMNESWGFDFILIKTTTGQTKQALATVAALCKKMNPRYPFNYSFLDTDFQKVYNSEMIVGKLITLFACLSIFIACLGLFGLAAFTAEQRTKEIGVRKVMGASVTNIVALLSGDFLKLVLVAILIAIPLAWYTMGQWLENFSYRISLSWAIFAVAGIIAISIAALTISFQSIKAALVNPITSLKSE